MLSRSPFEDHSNLNSNGTNKPTFSYITSDSQSEEDDKSEPYV